MLLSADLRREQLRASYVILSHNHVTPQEGTQHPQHRTGCRKAWVGEPKVSHGVQQGCGTLVKAQASPCIGGVGATSHGDAGSWGTGAGLVAPPGKQGLHCVTVVARMEWAQGFNFANACGLRKFGAR